MDVTWIEVLAGSLLAIALLVIPGAGCALLMRAPRPLVLISAPLLSISLIAGAAFLAPRLAMDWGWGTLALISCPMFAMCALAGALSWWVHQHHERAIAPRAMSWEGQPIFLPLAMALSGAVYVIRLIRAIGEPYAVSQTYDAPFHLNAVFSMLARGNASFLNVSLSSQGEHTTFYPAVWHELVSLVVLGTGLSIPGAVNAVTIALTAVLWPLGVAVCVGWIFRSWNVAALGALLAFSLSQMPIHFIWFGVLYPNLLSYILLIFMLTLAAYALIGQRGTEARLLAVVLGIAVMPAFAVAHPSGFFTFILLVFPILAVYLWRVAGALPTSIARKVAQPLSILCLLAVYAGVNQATFRVESLAYMRENIWYWPPIGGVPGGLLRAFTLTAGWDFRHAGVISLLIGAVAFVGAVSLLRHPRGCWLPLSHLIVIALYVVSYALPGPWRPYIIGLWYSDPHRFVAMLGITGAPLFICGLLYLGQKVYAMITKRFPTGVLAQRTRPLVACAIATTFAVTQFSGVVANGFNEISTAMAFDTSTASGTLSLDERHLIKELSTHIPPDTVLLSNPWNGSPYTPALSGFDVAFPHTVGYPDDEANFVANNLNNPAHRARVCEIVKTRHMTHILDFDKEYLWNGDPNGGHFNYPDLERARQRGTAETIAQQGRARLLRITVCD